MTIENFTLSLIIPCYNEENTVADCVEKVRKINDGQNFNLEIIIVNDASTDNSALKLREISSKYPDIKILTHEKNRGKGAALRTGLMSATGDYVGIQDADDEYDPLEYRDLLKPMLEDKADVVYGSRYLRPQNRRVLYFWHTYMNKFLTAVSNMFTDLDITDMETCYKLFKRDVIQKIAPTLKEERFGFEPEITSKVAQLGARVYECAISYNPRTYEEGKKIGWKDGVRALYCLLHYGAHTAPLPMQILIYLFIGAMSLVTNMFIFIISTRLGISLDNSIIAAYIGGVLVNYLLCITILFRHKAYWSATVELFWYVVAIAIMGGIDFAMMKFMVDYVPFFNEHWGSAKFVAASAGFVGNFLLRKMLVFPERIKNK